MIALEIEDLVVIVGHIFGLDTIQALNLIDLATAEHALAEARQGDEPADPATSAAVLLHALVRQRPLRHGNKQVALVAMLQFLALNGWDMDPGSPESLAAMVAQLAAGALDTKAVADWLAPRLRSSDRAAVQAVTSRSGTTTGKEIQMRERPAIPFAGRIKRAAMRSQPKSMFAQFNERARRVVVLAQGEAGELGHGSVGTEHLLLGLLAEAEGVAAQALESLGISLEEARDRVEQIVGRGPGAPQGHIPFTSPAKRVLELAMREALQLGHQYICTEHLLLSLLARQDDIAVQVLAGQGADYGLVKQRVIALLTGRFEQADPKTRLVRLPMPTDLADAMDQLRQVQQQKTVAFEAGDLDSVMALRTRERHLRAERRRLEREWAADVDVRAVITENQRVHRELGRLRDMLLQHGIEPDGGSAQTA